MMKAAWITFLSLLVWTTPSFSESHYRGLSGYGGYGSNGYGGYGSPYGNYGRNPYGGYGNQYGRYGNPYGGYGNYGSPYGGYGSHGGGYGGLGNLGNFEAAKADFSAGKEAVENIQESSNQIAEQYNQQREQIQEATKELIDQSSTQLSQVLNRDNRDRQEKFNEFLQNYAKAGEGVAQNSNVTQESMNQIISQLTSTLEAGNAAAAAAQTQLFSTRQPAMYQQPPQNFATTLSQAGAAIPSNQNPLVNALTRPAATPQDLQRAQQHRTIPQAIRGAYGVPTKFFEKR